MAGVFVSYAIEDRYFAELLGLKLAEGGIDVWRDQTSLVAGSDWRQAIDLGIRDAAICVVVLSRASAASHYVTYEWATAMAQGKTIIPLMLEDCDRHPKIEPIQFIDFRSHSDATWQRVSQRVQDALANHETLEGSVAARGDPFDVFSDPGFAATTFGPGATETGLSPADKTGLSPADKAAEARIIAYLNGHGYRMVSLEGITKYIDKGYDEALMARLAQHSDALTNARLAGNKPGLKLI